MEKLLLLRKLCGECGGKEDVGLMGRLLLSVAACGFAVGVLSRPKAA